MSQTESEELLKEISDGWKLVDNKEIRKEFAFKDFPEALAFVNKVGAIAETEGHHPNIFLHDWNKVDLTLSTHAIGGLSENDFILAAKIDTLRK
ncbi:MAG TPA: 4a-hydroxytetrahydrobiopterin dehydratase [Candidatus Paceibacterota bacterium]|nr:4a-hydroxytetrahydrobiopterin dehydratase [Candidatus Paceibacterota bacterium]